MLTLDSKESWDVLQQLGMLQPRPVLIALLREVSTEAYLRAMALGAVAALGRNAPPDDVSQVFVHATKGKSLLPTEILSTLVARAQPVGGMRPLYAREIDLTAGALPRRSRRPGGRADGVLGAGDVPTAPRPLRAHGR
jgi:DNA-binding NarL/FixJ family response regulator